MKKNVAVLGLLGICILAILIIQLPFSGYVSSFLPGLVIFASALVICRRRLRVGTVILAAVVSLVALPVASNFLLTVCSMLFRSVMPLWLNGILSCILQDAFTLAVFALVCRILRRGKNNGVRGIHVLIASVFVLVSAVLDGASYGFVSELPTVMDMLAFISSRNPLLALLSQVIFYGAIFFIGFVMLRNTSDDVADEGMLEQEKIGRQ